MALSFPLSLDSFLRDLPVVEMTFDPLEGLETITLGSGEVLTASLGTRLWTGSITLATSSFAQHEDLMVLLRALQRPGASFYCTPLHRERPGAPSGTLYAVSGRDVRFSGLSANAVIPRGAFFSFSYGSNPTRRAFHQLAQRLTASSSGVTGSGEVVPPIRPGFTLGAECEFESPILKAVIMPKSLKGANLRGRIAEGVTFAWQQTLR